MQDIHLKPINDLTCIIASRLEMLHMGGRLRDKEGNACNSTGTGIPLSTIDREELFLAARCGIIAAKWRKDDFLSQWRAASREARAALYRELPIARHFPRAGKRSPEASAQGSDSRKRFPRRTFPNARGSTSIRLTKRKNPSTNFTRVRGLPSWSIGKA